MSELAVIEAEVIEDDTDLPAVLQRTPGIALREGKTAEETVIADWIGEQKSLHTRRSYQRSFDAWLARLEQETCCNMWWPHRRHAFTWRDEMIAAGAAPKTVDSRLIAVRSFYDHLCDRDDNARRPINPIKSKKLLLNQGARQQTASLSPTEVEALTKAARKAGPDRRLLVLFLVVTGCRISEAVNLKAEDLQRHKGHPVAMLTRKGGKRGPAGVDPQVFELLVEHCKGSDPTSHVFQPRRAAGRTGGGFTYSGAYAAVRSISKAADLTVEVADAEGVKRPKVHPHMLRATLITACFAAKKEVTDIQDQVGHAKTETTKAYNTGGARVREMASISGVMAGMTDLAGE